MSVYRNWFLASRPWSFSMTFISVSVGAALAALDGSFSWFLYIIALLGAVFMHGATNLINDYYDVLSGVDTLEVSTAQYRPHPVVEGKLTPVSVRNGAYLLYGIASVMGIYLAATRGWPVLVIGVIGIFAGLTYTAPPLKYKYSALGEVSVFIMWGPLMVEGAYFVQRQALSETALWVSMPFGVLVALVLFANNIRDIRYDQERGIKTIALLLGKRRGLWLYITLAATAYLAVLWMAFFGPLGLWSLIVLLSLPLAYRLFREVRTDIPDDADARTAQLNTVFGFLLVLSLILEVLF
jgi:1,4-dihydroxy-2-naphthoate octaprenyltransferase